MTDACPDLLENPNWMYISGSIQVYAKYEPSKDVWTPYSIFWKLGERPYKCDQCSSAFVHLYSLTAHKRRHTGIFFMCGNKFSQRICNFPEELFIYAHKPFRCIMHITLLVEHNHRVEHNFCKVKTAFIKYRNFWNSEFIFIN